MSDLSSILEEARKKELYKVVASNMINRLRELDSPSESDSKRWVWELIQNAKDSISSSDRETVDVNITSTDDKVVFTHNGEPFNEYSFHALLYKYSSGKENDPSSTGRFGTGFLTTHALSKTVQLESNIVVGDYNRRFYVTMYRDGKDSEELIEGLLKMERETKFTEDINDKTIFTYLIKTDRNKDSVRAGIESFHENILKTMIFNPQIGNISANFNGTTVKIMNSINRNDLKQYKLTFGEKTEVRTFYISSLSEHSDELTKRYNTERSIKITLAIEVNNNKIVYSDKGPSVFCSLPLIGSESFKLPFTINSNDFEPDTERNFLLLNGNDTLTGTDLISPIGINRIILKKCINLFDKLVSLLSTMDIENFYALTRGLGYVKEIDRLDYNWYMKNIVSGLREVVMKYPIVRTNKGWQKIENVLFPKYSFINEENRNEYYNLVSRIYPNESIPNYEDSLKWSNCLWSDERIRFISPDFLSNNIVSIWEKGIDVYNSCVSFIFTNFPNIVKEKKILVNQNYNLIYYNNNIFDGSEVPDEAVDCIEKLGGRWKETHIINSLTGIKIHKHDINYAMNCIKELQKKKYQPENIMLTYLQTDSETQRKIYNFAKMVYRIPKVTYVNFPDETVWEYSNRKVISTIIQHISTLNDNQAVEFANFIYNYDHELLYNESIIPTRNGARCNLNDIIDAKSLPQDLLDAYCKYIDTSLSAKIPIDGLSFIIPHKMSIADFVNKISKYFEQEQNKEHVYTYPYTYSRRLYIPQISNSNEHLFKFSLIIIKYYMEESKEEQERITRLAYQTGYIDNTEIKMLDGANKLLWDAPNRIVTERIFKNLEEKGNIENVALRNGMEYSQFIKENLELMRICNHKIFPNVYGKFTNLRYLFSLKNIPHKLINVVKDNLKEDINENAPHSSIESFLEFPDYDLSQMASVINYNISKFSVEIRWTVAKTVLSCIPREIQKEEKEKLTKREVEQQEKKIKIIREEQLFLIKNCNMFTLESFEPVEVDLCIELYSETNNIVINRIINCIEEKRNINNFTNIEEPIKVLNSFITYLKEKHFYEFEKRKIFPNQKGEFLELEKLKNDTKIPEKFKEFMKNDFGFDIKEMLINQNIEIKCNSDIRYDDILRKIRENINDMSVKTAEKMISFCPKDNEKLESFCTLYSSIMGIEIEQTEIDTSITVWYEPAINILTKEAAKTIRNDKTLSNFALRIGLSEEEAVAILNNFYKQSTDGIIPNMNGEFCCKNKLYTTDDIDDTLIKILKDLNEEEDFSKCLVHKGIKVDLNKKYIKDIAIIIDRSIQENLKNVKNDEEIPEKTKNSCKTLIFNWYPHNEENTEHFSYVNDNKDRIIIDVCLTKEEKEKFNEIVRTNPEKYVTSIIDLISKKSFAVEKQENIAYQKQEIIPIEKQKRIIEENPEFEEIITNEPSFAEFIQQKAPIKSVIASNPIISEFIYHNQFFRNQFIEYQTNYTPEGNAKEDQGYYAEAMVWDCLSRSNKFDRVEWCAYADHNTGRYITYRGQRINIKEDGQHYDIKAYKNGIENLIEVKSTTSSDFQVKLSSCQFDTICHRSPNSYLALVHFDQGSAKILIFKAEQFLPVNF